MQLQSGSAGSRVLPEDRWGGGSVAVSGRGGGLHLVCRPGAWPGAPAWVLAWRGCRPGRAPGRCRRSLPAVGVGDDVVGVPDRGVAPRGPAGLVAEPDQLGQARGNSRDATPWPPAVPSRVRRRGGAASSGPVSLPASGGSRRPGPGHLGARSGSVGGEVPGPPGRAGRPGRGRQTRAGRRRLRRRCRRCRRCRRAGSGPRSPG